MGVQIRPGGRVLIVDDSVTIRRAIRLILQPAGLFDAIDEADSGQQAFALLTSTPGIELIICDVIMPGIDGFELLKLIKENPSWRDIPVIMLTGQESVDKKVLGLELGASDYLTKPFDHAELIARIKVQLKLKRLQDELRDARQRYRQLSITDPLTGLYNRRYFFDLFTVEFDRCRRRGLDLALLMIDIDNFKRVNDTRGHQTGDGLLNAVARALDQSLPSGAVLARYGGEEFSAMLPGTGREQAAGLGHRLLEAAAGVSLADAADLRVTVSIGIACHPGQGIETSESMLKAADDALYRAKADGKARCCLHA